MLQRNDATAPTPDNTPAISLTGVAAKRIQDFLAKRGKGIGIRLGVTTTGCSGLAYKLEFVDQINSDDTVFDSHGVTIMVDSKSLQYLAGTQLDYVEDENGLQAGFKYINPNVKGECGCGESFTV